MSKSCKLVFLYKNKKKVAQFMSVAMKFLVLFCLMMGLDVYVTQLSIENLGQITKNQLCGFINLIFISIVLYFLIRKIAAFCSNTFIKYITYNNRMYHVFDIDKGDKNLQQKIVEETRGNTCKALISFILSVIINIISGVIATVLINWG